MLKNTKGYPQITQINADYISEMPSIDRKPGITEARTKPENMVSGSGKKRAYAQEFASHNPIKASKDTKGMMYH